MATGRGCNFFFQQYLPPNTKNESPALYASCRTVIADVATVSLLVPPVGLCIERSLHRFTPMGFMLADTPDPFMI